MTAGVVIRGAMKPGYEKVLTPEAIDFAVELEREFGPERRRLLVRRAEIQRRLDAGWKPDFLPETKAIREGDWRVAPIPRDVQDRRVEITGPTDRKMVINALNCGANVFMADFEDANTPTWDNLIEGQANLGEAVRRTIAFDDPQTGRHYSLNGKTAVLFVRPRGWHLPEKHVLVDGEPMSGHCSTSRCSSFTIRKNWWRAVPALTSTCRSLRATSKRGCGTTSSCTRSQGSVCLKERSTRPC
jgi:malate synthase